MVVDSVTISTAASITFFSWVIMGTLPAENGLGALVGEWGAEQMSKTHTTYDVGLDDLLTNNAQIRARICSPEEYITATFQDGYIRCPRLGFGYATPSPLVQELHRLLRPDRKHPAANGWAQIQVRRDGRWVTLHALRNEFMQNRA